MDPSTFTDRGRTGVFSCSSKPYNAIVANPFTDTDGSKYMIFESFWQDIFREKMKAVGTKVSSSSNIAYDPSGTHAVEGAYMYKYGTWYYLSYSVGICCGYDSNRPAPGKEYKIKVCRGDSVTGHFVSWVYLFFCVSLFALICCIFGFRL
jgi:arabinan endo-1,5-alpha-L-arabinosidase